MRELPVDFQIALELAYWEGLKGAEIASVLEINEHTVRSRLSRGRKLLRERVEAIATVAELATTLASIDARIATGDKSL